MQLSKEAKEYLKLALAQEDREFFEQQLDMTGTTVFDHEDTEKDLIPCVITCVEAGDLELEYMNTMAHAKGCGHQAYMAYLDVHEFWE